MDGTSVQARPRVAVSGDGLEGLACAHYLRRSGIDVSVFAGPEPSRELAGRFLHGSAALERFHASIRSSDAALLGLVNDLGGSHRLVWRSCTSSLHTSAVRERAPLLQRTHAALVTRWILRYGRYARNLDGVDARSWLCARAGERLVDQVFEPLLRAQLGELDDGVSAATAWRTLTDLFDPREQRFGYLRGGTSALLSALRERLRGAGVAFTGEGDAPSWRVRPDRIELEGDPSSFDALVSTVPSCLEGGGDPASPRDTLVSVALVVRSALPLAYRSVCADPGYPAGTCYRGDLLTPREDTAGHRVHYFTRRARAGQPLEPREVLEKQARDCLRRLAGDAPVEIEATSVSTACVPSPTLRTHGAAIRPVGPLFVSRADAHACGEGTDLEASVLAARTLAERVRSYLQLRRS